MRRTPPLSTLFALTCAGLLLVVPATSPAQAAQAPTTIAYDVISIKPNKTGSDSSRTDADNGRLTATNVSLKSLLGLVYDIKQDLISGIPGPLDSARFDIEAKVVNGDPAAIDKMTREQRHRLLLPPLTDRFHLQTHMETRTLPVYELVVAKGGPKFKPSANQSDAGGGSVGTHGSSAGVKLSAQNASIETIAKALSRRLDDRTVIDKTGLAGNFDLDMQWSDDTDPANPLPSIFTAIQEQLGLKLVPAKGPVETLVVDHAEMPTEN